MAFFLNPVKPRTRGKQGPRGKRWRKGEGKRTKSREASDHWHAANVAAGFCKCGRPRKGNLKSCAECLDRTRDLTQRYRAEVLAHYGNKCVCCGEMEEAFLTMDHMNNNGAHQRSTERNQGNTCYWLRQNGFPTDFQILCYNCNYSKARRGMCPHEARRQGLLAPVPNDTPAQP